MGADSLRTVNAARGLSWRAWIEWTVATALGFAAGTAGLSWGRAAADVLAWPAGRSLMAGAFFGIAAGLMQWLILRQWMQGAGRYVAASAVGSAAGFILLDLQAADTAFPLLLLTVGAVVGFSQWLVLRAHLQIAGYWIAASMGSALMLAIFPLVFLGGAALGEAVGPPPTLIMAAGALLWLLLPGGMQAGVLVGLWREEPGGR